MLLFKFSCHGPPRISPGLSKLSSAYLGFLGLFFNTIINMRSLGCIGDSISIVRVGIRASVKSMIRRGAASLILGWF